MKVNYFEDDLAEHFWSAKYKKWRGKIQEILDHFAAAAREAK